MTMEIKFNVLDAEFADSERAAKLMQIAEHEIDLLQQVLLDHGLTGTVCLESHVVRDWLKVQGGTAATFTGVRFDWMLQEAVADYMLPDEQEGCVCLTLMDVALRMEDGSLRPA